MPGIFPELTAGGLVTRNAAGAPTNPPGVERAYVPAATFVITPCTPTALPSDCTARIEPRQLNAIVSELLSLAECFDPNGPWNCDSFQNLCTAFRAWVVTFVYIGDAPPAVPMRNQLWFESDTGFTYIWYDDGTSQQWVQIAGDKPAVDNVTIVGVGVPASPLQVGILDCGLY